MNPKGPDGAWWAEQWSHRMAASGWGQALETGTAWLGRNQILHLRFSTGRIQAQADSSGTGWAHFPHLTTRPWAAAEWTTALQALGAESSLRAAVLVGRLPRQAEAVLAAHGLSLLPGRMRSGCSCGSKKICEHAAALASRSIAGIAEDPARLLLLQGRTLASVQSSLRGIEPPPAPRAAQARRPVPAIPIGGAPADLGTFWQPADLPLAAVADGEVAAGRADDEVGEGLDAELAHELGRMHGLIRQRAAQVVARFAEPPPLG